MELERLIGEVNRVMGVRLERTDPILAAGIINEMLLDKALAKLDQHIKVQMDRVTAAATQSVLESRREGEAIVTQGGAWIEKRINEAAQKATAILLADLREEAAKSHRAIRFATRAAWVAGVGCMMILSGLGGIALATIW
jgi:hypothetical protein